MKVKEADDWTSEIYFKDKSKLMFESPADMLEFYTSPEKYAADEQHKNRANFERITVKDYKSRQPVDARQASFVYGSKIEGPMGPDLFPFAKKEDAESFIVANGGTAVSLSGVTSDIVRDARK